MLLNIYFYFFKYLRVPVDIKKLCEYPHNRYSTNMNMSTERIFIQQIRYGRATIAYPTHHYP